MSSPEDTNAAFWKSDAAVGQWVAKMEEREAKRDAQWRFMGELLPYGTDDAFIFADLGAGTGSAARRVLDLYPHSTAILADFSSQMMGEGELAMASYEGRFRYVELDMGTGSWPNEIPDSLGAVITSQCVHHLPDERKRVLFAEIRDHLGDGGWYVNFDPVVAPDASVGAVWSRVNERLDPASAEHERHLTPEELARHENHVRYMIPLDEQVQFLRDAGFEAVDVYWKHLDYVIYGGRRPTP
jgi:tRNA (cmo5U34)-methyltransferase